MGQQQLLLLVLSTVIVGLATVAGIQAFEQNQSQAAQDALTQKAVSIASDIQAQHQKPEQLGGIDFSNDDASTVANKIGFGNTVIPADGAGEGARCEIFQVTVNSTEGAAVRCAADNAEVEVEATFEPGADPEISTTAGSFTVSSL